MTHDEPDPKPGTQQGETGLGRFRDWLGLERNILVMLAAVLVVGMGEELWTRFIPKYLKLLGASTWVVAVFGTQKDVLDALYQYPGGWLADRLGRRSALVLFTVLASVGYSLYLVGPRWEWILVGTFFVIAWHSLTLPALFAIVGDSLPQTRRAIGFGVQTTLNRVPMVLGPPLGGWFISSLGLAAGLKLGFGINIALALAAIVIIWRYYVEKAAPERDRASVRDIWRGMGAPLKRLLVADCLARLAEGLPDVFLILYVTEILRGTSAQFGWLISMQMLVAVLVAIPAAKLSDRRGRRPFVLWSFATFALFPLALVWATGLVWVVVAFVIGGVRQIGEPARRALIVDLAAGAARGRAVGMYFLIRGLVITPAALIGGWLWRVDPRWLFYAAVLAGAASTLVYAVWGTDERAACAG